MVSEDDWNNKYKAILSADIDEAKRLKEQAERWAQPSEDGRGAFVLERHENLPVASNFNFKQAVQE